MKITPQHIKKDFYTYIVANDHPCIMAQTLFKTGKMHLHTYKDFGSYNDYRDVNDTSR